MSGLTVNGRDVSLVDKGNVQITIENPLFGGRGSYSFPIEFPLVLDENRLAIENMQNIQVSGDRSKTFDAKFSFFGIDLIVGQAGLLSLTDDFAELVLKGNELDFWERLGDAGLYSISWPDMPEFDYEGRTLTTLTATMKESLTTHKPYVAFEMIDEAEFDTRKSHWNCWEISSERFSVDTVDGDAKYAYTVFLRVYAVFDYLFSALGYEVKENYFSSTDDLKDIVVLNIFDINSSPWVNWRNLLPQMTIAEYLKAWESAGIDFNINTAMRTVHIRPKDDVFRQPPRTISNVMHKTNIITPDIKNGYRVNMSGSVDGYAREELPAMYNTYEMAKAIREASIINKASDLLPPIWEAVAFVKQEGLFYEALHNGSTYVWEKRTGMHQPIVSGLEENVVEVDLSIAYTKSEPSEFMPEYEKPTIHVNLSDEYDLSGILITCYRGMIEVPFLLSGRHCPHANYVPYGPGGEDLEHSVDLTTGFFFNLQKKLYDFLANSYRIEFKRRMLYADLLSANLFPMLYKGQFCIVNSVSFNCKGTDTSIEVKTEAYVRQITPT